MRPDHRDPDVVWRAFDEAFEVSPWAHVSWAIGSDWGAGLMFRDEADYRAKACERMTRIYGPRPLGPS